MEEQDLQKEIVNAEQHYSEEKMWTKLKKVGRKTGSSVVYSILLLYYTLQKPEVPPKSKAIIIGAIGYFILPLDLIPDFITGTGYVDDLGALGVALLQVAMYIDDDVKQSAKNKLKSWFGNNLDTSAVDNKIGS